MSRWDYKKEDFLTVVPYEELYSLRKDPFEHSVAMNEMAQYAKEIDFNGFRDMYKSFVETQKARSGMIYIDNATGFTGQDMELRAGTWRADDDGVRREGRYNTVDVACPHPILPVERLVNIDTGEEKLRIAFRKGAIWRRIIVDKDVLANANKVTGLAKSGVAVTSQNAKSLVEYISDLENLNYDIIPEKKSIGRLGYIPGEGFSPYVDDLIFDGDMNYAALFKSVHKSGSYKKWLDVASKARSMSLTARIVLASSFASVLLEPMGCLPFFVHLWSVDSGTGKTVALMLAASVWGDPSQGAYVKTFYATDVGHEKTAAFLNHLPLCLDELQLTKDNHGRSSFDVYKLAQGVGKTRGNRSGGVDLTPTWKNCILTTGESPLTGQSSGAGAINRVIDIECKAASAVITDGINVSAALKRNYGHAGKKFVEKLYSPGVIESLIGRYQSLVRDLSDHDTTEKQAIAAASIILADQLMCEWIFSGSEDPITVDQIVEFLASKAAVSAGDRGYKYLCDWVASNSGRLRGRADGGGEVYGIVDEDAEGNATHAYIVRSVFDRVLQEAGYSTSALLSYLKEKNLIVTRGRNRTRGKRINGILVECVCLILPNESKEISECDELPL